MLRRLDPHPIVAWLLVGHLLALFFGLVGLLYVLPNLGDFADDEWALRVYQYSMRYAGSTHIILGAAAMFAFGWFAIGLRKTAIFAAATYAISLTFELVGTGTGWPFGNYSYTDFLGWKVLGHVPYTIPLSWFYMGFASYLFGVQIAGRFGKDSSLLWTCGLGAWFLTVWDLALDPAMAHSSLRVQFWIWHESGPYYEMPIRNLVAWSVTGLTFMVASRLLWREAAVPSYVSNVPLLVYTFNIVFAMVVSADVGLWGPVLLASVFGIAPAIWASRQAAPNSGLMIRAVPNDG